MSSRNFNHLLSLKFNTYVLLDRKLRITTEDSIFRHVPKRRCPGIKDADGFEKDSLHSNFFISNEKVQEQKATKKRRDSALKPIIKNDDNLSAIDQTRRLLRSRSKDDIGVPIPTKKIYDYIVLVEIRIHNISGDRH
jgi:hypothetical protein